MNKLILPLILFLAVYSGAESQSFFDRSDSFFKKNVSNGRIDYEGIKKNRAELDGLVKEIEELDLSNMRVEKDYVKAFYINAYNILVIKQVVDLYPIYGPLKVDGFFNGISHTIMGQDLTLDGLEKGTLYKEFPDARLHFVLVCAAKGCPPIADFAYKPEGLDQQLEDRTKHVLNLDWFIQVNKGKAKISQIFDWYQGDFKKQSGSTVDYINTYREVPIKEKPRPTFYEYDWSLNNKEK